ncbi:KTU protein, partial [Amia calva]|nr:KTU protein [Amia calva]
MEPGSKYEGLNLTPEEVDRFSKAFKDEKFRQMLWEYADEISNPENKKKYEEEIAQMEQERGMDVRFIHPAPARALKTSVGGGQKCFINICTNHLIHKPGCRKSDAAEGMHWTLPYSLTPGRQEMDPKGNKHWIYDVVFHPDTLHMAGKNDRFMKMIDKTAMDAIEEHYNVQLDERNVKVLKMKYKGVPHPAVLRKPLADTVTEKEPADPNDPLRFPYPYNNNNNTTTQKHTVPSKYVDGKTEKVTPDPAEPGPPTEPNYKMKFRSYIDLQDYRCSRDSAPSPRPREIVITVDLPLLSSAGETGLDVTENRLLLQSQKPAYRLDVTLPYPVDEQQGHARFIKGTRQLVVTLPVLPLKQDPTAGAGGPQQVVSEAPTGDGSEHETATSQLPTWQESSIPDAPGAVTNHPSLQVQNKACVTVSEGVKLVSELTESAIDESPDVSEPPNHNCDVPPFTSERDEVTADCDVHGQGERDADISHQSQDKQSNKPGGKSKAASVFHSNMDSTVREENSSPGAAIPETGTDPRAQGPAEDPASLAVCWPGAQSSERSPSPDITEQSTEPVAGHLNPDEPAFTREQTTGTLDVASTGETARKAVCFKEEVAEADVPDLDEDDLPTEQETEFPESVPAPAIIREVNTIDGEVEVISNHTTSAAFSFHNSLLYELD